MPRENPLFKPRSVFDVLQSEYNCLSCGSPFGPDSIISPGSDPGRINVTCKSCDVPTIIICKYMKDLVSRKNQEIEDLYQELSSIALSGVFRTERKARSYR